MLFGDKKKRSEVKGKERIGKERIGKERIGKERKRKERGANVHVVVLRQRKKKDDYTFM